MTLLLILCALVLLFQGQFIADPALSNLLLIAAFAGVVFSLIKGAFRLVLKVGILILAVLALLGGLGTVPLPL